MSEHKSKFYECFVIGFEEEDKEFGNQVIKGTTPGKAKSEYFRENGTMEDYGYGYKDIKIRVVKDWTDKQKKDFKEFSEYRDIPSVSLGDFINCPKIENPAEIVGCGGSGSYLKVLLPNGSYRYLHPNDKVEYLKNLQAVG
jgi:hypothetical protein